MAKKNRRVCQWQCYIIISIHPSTMRLLFHECPSSHRLCHHALNAGLHHVLHVIKAQAVLVHAVCNEDGERDTHKPQRSCSSEL